MCLCVACIHSFSEVVTTSAGGGGGGGGGGGLE